MNKIMHTALASLFAFAAAAHASPEVDIKYIRTLLPAGMDVAQVQANLLRGSSETEAFEAAKNNYLVRDINGDGLADVLVITEEQPRFENWETNQPCASLDEQKCSMVFGKRTLSLFYAQADDEMELAFTNDKMVRGADEGGVWGDPLEGLSVTNRGSIKLSIYGGSSWRWSFTDTMQFRDGDFFVIGQDSYSGWNGDGRSETKSVNLITGRVVETTQKDLKAPVKTKTYHVARKPLVKVADYTGAAQE